ncbi:MAG: MMPL family transporter [Acidobacteriota bacterium]
MGWWARVVARRPAWVLIATVVLAVLASWPASRLGLRTDLVALLPDGTPRADDYRVFLERFGGFEKVFVMIEPDIDVSAADRERVRGELLATASRLEAELAQSPDIAYVTSGVRPEDETFFYRSVIARAPLLIDGDGWRERIASRLQPAEVRARARAIKAMLASPAGGLRADWLRHDPLGFSDDLGALGATAIDLPIDPLTGGFLATGDDATLLTLTPARAEIDPEGGRALVATLDAAFAMARAETDVPVRMRAIGGPMYAAHDEALLREDLQLTVTTSLIGCSILLVLAFGGFGVPTAVLAPLALALLWSAGVLGAVLGDLTAAGLGFAAILVGLGIDYGIHGGVRYRDRRLAGADRYLALHDTFQHAGPAIATSAVTTAVAFASLAVAHYRPLRELGWMVAVGILAILIATATAGAAALSLVPTRSEPGWLWRVLGRVVQASVRVATTRPRWVLAVSAVVTLVAGIGLTGLRIEPDLDALRPEDAPIRATERALVERFAVGLDTATVVVHGDDPTRALSRATAVVDVLRDALGDDAQITSPSSWLRGDRFLAERLDDLADLPFATAADELEAALGELKIRASAFAPGLDVLRALARGELAAAAPPPPWVTELIRSDDDGTWVAVRVRVPDGTWPSGPPDEVIAQLATVAPGSAFASVPAFGVELRRTATADLGRIALLALLAVAVVVGVAFRGAVGRSVQALVPVTLGVIVTLGLWAWLDRPLDLLGLTVMPIMLGIGIDDGLHAVHGSRREGGVGASVLGAGRAMALTTLTTCVGFGSLTLSRVPGLRHGGQIVAVGVVVCLLATLFVLPAWDTWRQRRKA